MKNDYYSLNSEIGKRNFQRVSEALANSGVGQIKIDFSYRWSNDEGRGSYTPQLTPSQIVTLKSAPDVEFESIKSTRDPISGDWKYVVENSQLSLKAAFRAILDSDAFDEDTTPFTSEFARMNASSHDTENEYDDEGGYYEVENSYGSAFFDPQSAKLISEKSSASHRHLFRGY